MLSILQEIAEERERAAAKWGAQNYPSVPALRGGSSLARALVPACVGLEHEDAAKRRCDQAFADGEGTWAHVAAEELSEAVCAPDERLRRGELVQLAAVIVGWIQCIDRHAP
jgi:hypothetical protein